jgi:hypothetical protein
LGLNLHASFFEKEVLTPCAQILLHEKANLVIKLTSCSAAAKELEAYRRLRNFPGIPHLRAVLADERGRNVGLAMAYSGEPIAQGVTTAHR